jgi:hypothetical protein
LVCNDFIQHLYMPAYWLILSPIAFLSY